MYDPHALKIYMDGSAYRNPGHEGGLAGIVEFSESLNREAEVIYEKSYHSTTNNRMELWACIKALEYIRENAKLLKTTRAVILTDSQYVNESHKVAHLWRKNGWRNRHDRPVENKDLWKEFLSLRSKTTVRTDIQWNAGKSTPLLKQLDKLAKRAAKSPIKAIDCGYRPGKVCRHRTDGAAAATLFSANNQELTIRVYAHHLAGRGDCRVSFSVVSEEDNRFVRKHRAYVQGQDMKEIHRHHCYKVRFNDNPQYPIFQIIEVLENCPGPAKPAGLHSAE